MDREKLLKELACLDNIGRNLTKLADEKHLGPIYEREEQIVTLASQLLLGDESVLLVGEPGVGKNAIIEGLAVWIARTKDKLPRTLSDVNIYQVTILSFQANCVYVHDFETRLHNVISECVETKSILFFDDLHLAISAGGTPDHEDRTIANLLLPFMGRKELRIIGATTPSGYSMMSKKNPAFINKFIKMEVGATSSSETLEILNNLKPAYEKKYLCKIDRGVLEKVINLSEQYYPLRKFPGKAFENLKAVIAFKKALLTKNATYDNFLKQIDFEKYRIPVKQQDVDNWLQKITGLPHSIILSNEKVTYSELYDYFGNKILGQAEAVKTVVDTIIRFKAKLQDRERPIATLLFAGPTGVGKTQMVKELAQYLFGSERRLLRYDMTEYSSPESVGRLIGVYHRSWERGKLIEDIIAQPFSVVLFDEIEKAAPEIMNLLLQVIGEGRLTESTGTVVSFMNSIIIMTSNLGSHLYGKNKIGFDDKKSGKNFEKHTEVLKYIEHSFSPEFFNRISDVVYFNPLSQKSIAKIASMEIDNLEKREGLVEKNIKIKYSSNVIDILIKNGYNIRYGARPMKRAVEKYVGNHLAQLLSENPTIKKGIVSIDIDTDGSIITQMS